MLLKSITVISQLFVNIWTYENFYAYDGPTTFMHLCLKKKKKKTYNSKAHKYIVWSNLWISKLIVGAYQKSLTNWFSNLLS